jgi:outer membrane protein
MKQILSVLLMFAPLLGFAQDAPKALSLKEAIEYGLQNHGSVKVYENEKQIASQRVRQSVAGLMPQVSANATLDDNLKRQVQVLPAGIFGPEETKVQFGTKYSSTIGATATQTLYDQALLAGLKANKPNREIANLSAQQNQENLVYNITEAYYQILISQTQLTLLQNNLDMYSKMKEVMELQVKKGVQPKVELDKVNVNLNNTESQITSTQNTIQQAKNMLKNSMGLQDESMDFAVVDPNFEQNAAPETTNFDYSQQTGYKLQQNNIALQEIDAKRIQASGLPKLSAYASYGNQGVNNNMDKLYQGMNIYSAIGLKVSIPLFDGLSRNSQVKQAKLRVSSAQENLKINEQNARMQYQNAKNQLQQTQLTLDNNKRNIDLAQKVFNTTKLHYEKGVNSLSDLLTSDQSLKQAQNTYIANLLRYYQSRLDVEKANGTLLSFYQNLN